MKNTVRLFTVIMLVLLCAGCHNHINDPVTGNGAFDLSGVLFYNHNPLPGAQVSIAENDKFTATSTDSGTFVMRDLPQGKYTLQIDKTFNDNAFLQVTRTVTIKGDLALDTLYLPLIPRLFQIAENRQNSVSLRWNVTDTPDFKSYRLYRHNSNTISDESGDLVYTGNAITDTTFQDTTLQSSASYYYRLYTFTTPGKIGGSNVLRAFDEFTGRLTGTLLYQNLPLAGASISVIELPALTVTSNEDGTFILQPAPNGSYHLRIQKAFADNSFLDYSIEAVLDNELNLGAIALPNVPLLKQLNTNTNSVTLVWNPTTCPDFQKYQLYRHTLATVSDETGSVVYTANSITDTLFTDNTVVTGTDYFYRLYCYSKQGKITGSNVLSPIIHITGAISGTLQYQNTPLAGATVTLTELPDISATSSTDGGFLLQPVANGDYHLRIQKTFADNSFLDYSIAAVLDNELNLGAIALPIVSLLLPNPVVTDSSVTLSWSLTDATNFSAYKLYRHTQDNFTDANGELIFTGDNINVCTFTDNNLQSATTYYYRLYTFTSQGKIGGSNVLSATTKEPEPPLIFFGNENSDDYINDFIPTLDGGIVVVGYTTDSNNNQKGWLVKLDHTMKVQWEKIIDKYELKSVIQTLDGCFVLTGSFKGYLLVMKINTSGETEWEQTFKDISGPGMDVLQTQNGDYYVISYTCRLLKLDSNGNQQWEKRLSTTQKGSKIIKANDGGYIVSVSNFVWNSSSLKFFKIDDEGSILKESESIAWRSGGKIYNTKDQNGYLIVGGAFYEGSSYMSYIKIDNQVNVLWEKRLSGHGSSGYLRDDGTFYGVGYNTGSSNIYDDPSQPCIIHINSEGAILKDIKLGKSVMYFYGYGIVNYDHDHYLLIGTKDRLCDPQYWINKDLDAFVTIRPWSELE
ncbi:MAG TPA: hypothetical protein PLP19_03950 [bacterium]|nr:hypothetical protein [bacterium]